MKISYILILVFIALSCNSKKEDPVPPVQLLTNTDVETGTAQPSNWLFYYYGSSTNFTSSWATEQASSPSHSLKITASGSDATSYSYWYQAYSGYIPYGYSGTIPYLKDVTLSVKIKSSLVGPGVSIAIRGDDTSVTPTVEKRFITTQGKTTITGDQDWTTYTVKLTAVDHSVGTLYVFLLLMPNTTGTVYFDDITLTYNN